MLVGCGFGDFYQEFLLQDPAFNTDPLDLHGSRLEEEDNKGETWVQVGVVMIYVQKRRILRGV
jgi:hypothetical protein